jgi:hypothetical protein
VSGVCGEAEKIMTDQEKNPVQFVCYSLQLDFDPEAVSIEELDALMQTIKTSLDSVRAVHRSQSKNL